MQFIGEALVANIDHSKLNLRKIFCWSDSISQKKMTTSQYKIIIIIHLLLIDSILAEALVQYKMFFM